MAERSDGSVVRSARVIQSRPWPQSWPRSTSFKGSGSISQSRRCRGLHREYFVGRSDFYLAPEMLRQEEWPGSRRLEKRREGWLRSWGRGPCRFRYGPEIDLWSLGVTTFSLPRGSAKSRAERLSEWSLAAESRRVGEPFFALLQRISGSLPFVGEGGAEDLRGGSGLLSPCRELPFRRCRFAPCRNLQ